MLFYLHTREYDDDDDGVVSLSIQLVPLLCLVLAHTHLLNENMVVCGGLLNCSPLDMSDRSRISCAIVTGARYQD